VKPTHRLPLGASMSASLKRQSCRRFFWACRAGKSCSRTWRSTPEVMTTLARGKTDINQKVAVGTSIVVLPAPLAVRQATFEPWASRSSTTFFWLSLSWIS
jgi:hypothetical protein